MRQVYVALKVNKASPGGIKPGLNIVSKTKSTLKTIGKREKATNQGGRSITLMKGMLRIICIIRCI